MRDALIYVAGEGCEVAHLFFVRDIKKKKRRDYIAKAWFLYGCLYAFIT